MRKTILLLFSLSCFLFISFLPSETASSPKDKTTSSTNKVKKDTNWVYYQDTDKITDLKTYYAYTTSKDTLHFSFPYTGGSLAALIIGKQDSSHAFITLKIINGQFVAILKKARWRIRFDSKPAETCNVYPPQSFNLKQVFLEPTDTLIDEIKSSKKVIIEAEFFSDGFKQIEFNTHGLAWKH